MILTIKNIRYIYVKGKTIPKTQVFYHAGTPPPPPGSEIPGSATGASYTCSLCLSLRTLQSHTYLLLRDSSVLVMNHVC